MLAFIVLIIHKAQLDPSTSSLSESTIDILTASTDGDSSTATNAPPTPPPSPVALSPSPQSIIAMTYTYPWQTRSCSECNIQNDFIGSDRWCICCSMDCYNDCDYCNRNRFCQFDYNVYRYLCLKLDSMDEWIQPCANNKCTPRPTPYPTPGRYVPSPPYYSPTPNKNLTTGLSIVQIILELVVPVCWFLICFFVCMRCCCATNNENMNRQQQREQQQQQQQQQQRIVNPTIVQHNSAVISRELSMPDTWFPIVSAELVPTPPADNTCAICLGHLKYPVITPCFHYFCQKCCTQLVDASGHYFITCPMCRHVCPLGEIRSVDFGGSQRNNNGNNNNSDTVSSEEEESTSSIERKFAQQEARDALGEAAPPPPQQASPQASPQANNNDSTTRDKKKSKKSSKRSKTNQ